VAAFRATLEELSEADLFLHVVDASAPDVERRLRAVRSVLAEIGLAETPELVVLNKVDRLPARDAAVLSARFDAVAVSATQRRGFEALLERVERELMLDEVSLGERQRFALAAEGG
jgi:GTP-binding protein HflX